MDIFIDAGFVLNYNACPNNTIVMILASDQVGEQFVKHDGLHGRLPGTTISQ